MEYQNFIVDYNKNFINLVTGVTHRKYNVICLRREMV